MTRLWISIAGLATVALGLVYLVAPSVLTDPSGFGDLSAEAATDVRATYGGLQLALGFFFMWCALDPQRHRMALGYATATFACLATARVIGLGVDGGATTSQVGVTIVEILGGLISATLACHETRSRLTTARRRRSEAGIESSADVRPEV